MPRLTVVCLFAVTDPNCILWPWMLLGTWVFHCILFLSYSTIFSGFSLVTSERNTCEWWTGPILCRLEELQGDCMTFTADVAMWTLALKFPKWCRMASGPILNCETAQKKRPLSHCEGNGHSGTLHCSHFTPVGCSSVLNSIYNLISKRQKQPCWRGEKTVFTAAQMIPDSWSVTRELDWFTPPTPLRCPISV